MPMVRVAMFLRKDRPVDQQCPLGEFIRRVAEAGGELVPYSTLEEVEAHLGEAEVYIGSQFPSKPLPAGSKLAWIHVPAAGCERVLVPAVVGSDIVVTNSRGTMAPEVAEQALGMMLALARGIDLSARAMPAKTWLNLRTVRPPITLEGTTLGIVGYGSIGRELARRAKALGMRVLGMRRHAAEPDGHCDAVLGIGDLPKLLEESDFVVLAVPLSEETRHLIGAAELEKMKPSAFLVNVARGAVVDEGALLDALQRGSIAGAASDVFSTEPLPPSSPLWDAPNMLITPHVAGASGNVWPRIIDLFCENLRRYQAGEPLLNTIDKQRGY